MTDDTKADALRSVLIWIALCIVILTAPTWLTWVEDAMQPGPIVVNCKGWG